MPILRLAMPTPLRRSFDYLPPMGLSNEEAKALQPGIRILAPFGPRKLVGILLCVSNESEIPKKQLKAAIQTLDKQPLLPAPLLSLCQWAASYYQHPIGDVLANALPTLLRKGGPLIKRTQTHWRLSTEGKGLPTGALSRAAKQAELLKHLQQHRSQSQEQLKQAGISRAVLKALHDKKLIESIELEQHSVCTTQHTEQALRLNSEQHHAYTLINKTTGYQCYLLEGVTGSGKTEVYLQLIDQCLQRGQQVLVLIPEIGLTPQTFSRFQRRFNQPISLLHSGRSDKERQLAWQNAHSGEARIVIGTRSAVFAPLPDLGLIIIDEEHDSSFKQQEGFRYCARDLSIKRAYEQSCPIVLGSATPCLETLNNALQGRYQHLQLNQRATGANAPTFELLDIRHAALQDGFSPPLISAIENEINRENQVLVFINRRGFSPMMMCHDCGYVAQCDHCDARMTVHLQQRALRCHHCENQSTLPNYCPSCNSTQLDFRGAGTERSEQALQRWFPHTPVIRIDRDTTTGKNAMQTLLDKVHQGEPCILVGTQMLAKGHHFADVTLVAVLNADAGLFSADFRSPERMGQLLVQVAGRAGRESKPGKVIIQTHQPEHPLINSLINNSFNQYARQLLEERRASGMPPFGHLVLIRAEANNIEQPEAFLRELRQSTQSHCQVRLLGPLPAPMMRKAGRFRAQLLIQSSARPPLRQALQHLCTLAEQHPLTNKVRWSIDVDPAEMF
ncbi:MAG: primosomal protein N' [Spongiibacteraceae bacterium]|nr:primosomal protein N' [Spongiibacteraceae bacterium]